MRRKIRLAGTPNVCFQLVGKFIDNKADNKITTEGKTKQNTAVKWIEYGYTTGIWCKQHDKGNSGEHAEQQTSSFKKSYL